MLRVAAALIPSRVHRRAPSLACVPQVQLTRKEREQLEMASRLHSLWSVETVVRKEREQLEAQKEEEPDPEQMAKDMERLALIKKRREDQARARIEKDGWDRMKPLSEDNHPPGTQWPPPGGAS